jgi:hypothetical protein
LDAIDGMDDSDDSEMDGDGGVDRVVVASELSDGSVAAKSVIFSRSEWGTLFDKYPQKRDGPIRVMVI